MSDEKKTVITDDLFNQIIASTLNKPSGISLEAARKPTPQTPTSVRVSDTPPVKNTQEAELPKEAQLSLFGVKIGYTETPERPAHVHHGLSIENPATIRSTQALLRF